jgi:5-(carboxyamino)imidazole ribonucleotide synthase
MSRFPLSPGSTIGVLGGGQLGRMLALAAARLGFDVAVLEPEADSPAARVAAHSIVASYDDPAGLDELARLSDVITFEFENVPAASVEHLLQQGADVAPGARALAVSQDRLIEKRFINEVGAPTVAFEAVSSAEEAHGAAQRLGLPALLKTRREGYDGKGQVWIGVGEDPAQALDRLAGRPAILEARAAFVRELSVIAARGRDGEIAVYPLGENVHEAGVLRFTRAPAQVSAATEDAARRIAEAILRGVGYVGVIGVELFELADGALLVNEFAPRVHNSGHWTEDGCAVSQFEQHIRAVAGWPLGPTDAIARVEMSNLLGDEVEGWAALAGETSSRPHLYGKRRVSDGRKMGHVNRVRPL